MGKNFGMSNLGYAIILVIIVAIVMIISAPMIVNSNKNKDVNSNNISDNKDMSNYDKDKLDNSGNDNNIPEDRRNNNENSNMDEVATMSSMRDLEQRLNSRIDSVELRLNDFINNMQSQTKSSNTSENYVCSIEGRLDANNNVVPIDTPQNSVDVKSQKLVFVCQYK